MPKNPLPWLVTVNDFMECHYNHINNPKTRGNYTLPCGLGIPWGLKLKSGGRGRPLGSLVLGSLNSSKKGWTQASNCNATT